MFKLLIVEDEPEIRAGLEAIRWETYGFECVGSFENGLEALAFIAEKQVHLVLSDIRMPFMDGIELSHSLNKHNPNIKVIMLTGHGDFSYMQKCMRNKTFDYLLKPLNLDELGVVLDRAIQALDEEKERSEHQSMLIRKERRLMELLRDDFMKKLLTEPLSEDEIEIDCSESEMILEGESYVVILLRLDAWWSDPNLYSDREAKLVLFALHNILSELWDDMGKGYHTVRQDKASVYLLATGRDAISELPEFRERLYQLSGLIKSTISIGVGCPVLDKSSIHLSAQSADSALNMLHEDTEETVVIAPDCPDLAAAETIVKPKAMAENGSADSLKGHFALKTALAYMRENFSKPLTLKEIAQQAYVHPSYLSHLFKVVTGINYIEHLARFRTEQAKVLLRDPKYKIYDVSGLVGYRDTAYFAEIFKRHTGMTPLEFRSWNG